MNFARKWHTATLLPNGKVLAAGGFGATGYLNSAEIYDPANGTWVATASFGTARGHHAATLLANGKVLLTGGLTGVSASYVSAAELYDPATGVWTATNPLATARGYNTATLLPSGAVLVAGGLGASGYLSSAESYDPVTGIWTAAGSLTTGRNFHTATLLPNGKVLVAGGFSGSDSVASAELFDPATRTWTASGTLATARDHHTATLLPNGKLLLAAGQGNFGSYLASAELFDVGSGFNASWQPQVATVTSPLSSGSSLAVAGSGFRGISEGSGGNSQDSSSDYPLVQVRSLESGRSLWLPATNWSANSFASAPMSGLPPGYAMATVFVNGIPSTSTILPINVPAPTPPRLTGAKKLANGSFQFGFTNNPGALFAVIATTDLALPSSNWMVLGGATEVSPGQFQFTDPQGPNSPPRFYRLRSP